MTNQFNITIKIEENNKRYKIQKVIVGKKIPQFDVFSILNELSIEKIGDYQSLVSFERQKKESPGILERRIKLNMSLKEVAKNTGLTARKVSRIEKGMETGPDEAKKISDFYDKKEKKK